jgi:mRNA interferase RelE/StbE
VKVRYEASFEKDLRKVKEKRLLRRVKEVIDEVKKADDLLAIKSLKKLKGYETFYRVRIGDYRIGIEVVKDEVIFTRILHRRDVYRYFP